MENRGRALKGLFYKYLRLGSSLKRASSTFSGKSTPILKMGSPIRTSMLKSTLSGEDDLIYYQEHEIVCILEMGFHRPFVLKNRTH